MIDALYSYIDHHPRSERFLLDSGGSYSRFWQQPLPRDSRPPTTPFNADRLAKLAAATLVEVSDRTNSYLLAIAVGFISGDSALVERLLKAGMQVHGRGGYSALLVLWSALHHQINGELDLAHQAYVEVAECPLSSARRSALASGSLLAAATGAHDRATWFIERMADEDPHHQGAVLDRVALLRRNRERASKCVSAEGRLLRLARTGYSASKWTSELTLD